MTQVVCAFIFRGDRFLIVQRPGYKAEPFRWELPGGKIEAGETESQAIIREILEELDIEILPVQRLGSVVHRSSDKAFELIAWRCDWVAGELLFSEHIDHQWVDFDSVGRFDLSSADIQLLSSLPTS